MPSAHSTPPAPRFDTLTVPKASDVLASEVRERILSGEFAEGTPLPPERQLVEQTGLSRATVREALRILEVERLVEIRPGRGGGAFVHRPGRESLANTVQLVIRGQQIRLEALHETREAIEPACAALAAGRRTEQDLADLDAAHAELVDAGDDIRRFLRANVRWHNAVARAGGNELLIGFLSALSESIYAATNLERFMDTRIREVTAQAHAKITEAIRSGDAAAARRRMSRHVCGFARAAAEVDGRERVELTEPED
ncbi:GntR family transcriptional repressor for pyruvate dehydrogenase complex [Streptomyces sp. B4I13]|uniref:FadR/GntR family transcriptional regulator n=1 Tax=Streptomyces sp. B4I13 TaxID=3042271 RepID=UPI002781D18C|nr:FadR/GntR family transcriptional regulator [Streptomyces sp. B4I13]MDQ0963325.1 GntR family transcriptional repressor for pyruvate dehydrogenase complex [Streptomyces sp. B4I13]